MRFASSTAHVRPSPARACFGRPLVAVCNTLWFRDAAYYAVPWRGKWATDFGGPTMGLGIHAMDHLLHLLGDWTEVRAVADTLDRAIEVEDVSLALIRFANGAHASVVNSALSPRQETYLRLDYQRATLELTHLYGYTRDNWKLTPADPRPSAAMQAAWNKFPARRRLDPRRPAQRPASPTWKPAPPPLTSGAEARRTLEFLTALYKSAYTGTTVTRGSILPGDPFYTVLHGGMAPSRQKK
jgi:predicted dehydrogenase